MNRRLVCALGLFLAGPGHLGGQILSDSDLAHFAGCYTIESGLWNLVDWSGDPADLPAVPARIELLMSRRKTLEQMPRPGPQTRGHVIDHPVEERQAKAQDSTGTSLPDFTAWRALNQRMFSIGVLGPRPRVELWVLDFTPAASEGRLIFWQGDRPPYMRVMLRPTAC